MAQKPTKRERKDEAKKRRMEELRRRQRRARRRKLTTWGIVGLIIAGVLGAILLSQAANNRAKESAKKLARAGGCLEPTGDLKIEGSQHVDVGTKVQYQTDPPTSGNHWNAPNPPAPAPTGIHANPLQDEQYVHNLEHGHIAVLYQPGALSAEAVTNLEAVVRANATTMLMAPRQNRDAKLAIVAWGRAQSCPAPNEKVDAVVRDFHKRFANQAPEKVNGQPVFQTSAPAASPKATTSPRSTARSTTSPRPTTTARPRTTAPATPG